CPTRRSSDLQSRAKEGAEDDVDAARREVEAAGIGPADVVVGVAASGRTPYTVAAVEHARERGAFTVGIANNPDTPLLSAAEVGVLLDTGPEVLAGSTRLAAGTAQKAALNALSTAAMVRMGGAYDNLMVAMRPLNAKLIDRAARIVAQAAGSSQEEAVKLLNAAGGDMRVAIVMGVAGASAEASAKALQESGGLVRAATESLRKAG